jgi:hypothetical protein
MASFQKFNQFVEDLAKGVHNFASHTCKIALTNTAPAAANEVLANITQITAGNGYSAGGGVATFTSCEQTSGVMKLILQDVTFTASGGSIGPFRYAVLYNDTPTSPADPLIGFWDRGSEITLLDGESCVIDLDQTNGVLSIT